MSAEGINMLSTEHTGASDHPKLGSSRRTETCFLMVLDWKQHQHPLTGELTTKLGSTHMTEHLSAIKRTSPSVGNMANLRSQM